MTMLNPEMHLVPGATEPAKLEQVPTRNGFGQGLVEAAEKDGRIVGLCADLTESLRMLAFKERFPDRFIQLGVHEQLLAALGAGFAMAGKIPFIASYAMFCPGRAWEQVRTNICLNDANVKIIGGHTGVTVGPDGATHQALEDIAIMRPIPNVTIVVPCDAAQARNATLGIAAHEGPCYLRLTREKSPVFTTKDTPFEIGKVQVLREGSDVALIACGPLVHSALLAAEELTKEGTECMVLNNHTVKPMDAPAIIEAARTCGAVVTVEEHQRRGGMGSRVAEILAQHLPVPMEFIGVDDLFGESGEPSELTGRFGLEAAQIADAARKAVGRKD